MPNGLLRCGSAPTAPVIPAWVESCACNRGTMGRQANRSRRDRNRSGCLPAGLAEAVARSTCGCRKVQRTSTAGRQLARVSSKLGNGSSSSWKEGRGNTRNSSRCPRLASAAKNIAPGNKGPAPGEPGKESIPRSKSAAEPSVGFLVLPRDSLLFRSIILGRVRKSACCSARGGRLFAFARSPRALVQKRPNATLP